MRSLQTSPDQCTGRSVLVFHVHRVQTSIKFVFVHAADIGSDCTMIAASMHLFGDLLDAGLRRRLTFIFSACIMTTVVSLVRAVYGLVGGEFKTSIVGGVEVCH